MSGNWNRTPRRGEKSINAVRSDQEHRIRIEYRDAGIIEGLVAAWSIAESWSRQCTSAATLAGATEITNRIAHEILSRFPKRGRMDLVNVGAGTSYLDEVEARVKAERKAMREATDAAKKLGAMVDGT